jgi:hypothetical protein
VAWIESHQTLGQHPKTRKLARLLNISVPTAVGHLQFLWWWAMDYAPDGSLERFEDADIADAMLWEGNAEALVDALRVAGFVDVNQIHDWDTYVGRLLDKKAANAERARVSRERARDVRVTNAQRATLPNQTKPNQTKEEKPAVSQGADAPVSKRVTEEYLDELQPKHPTVNVREVYADARNRKTWDGYKDQRRALLKYIGWAEEKVPRNGYASLEAKGQNVMDIHKRNKELERIAWERKNPGIPFEVPS